MKAKLRDKRVLKRAAMAVIVLAFLTGIGIMIRKASAEETESAVYKETQVQRGDLMLGLIESGTVDLVTKSVSYELEINDSEEDEDDDEEDGIYLMIEEVYAVPGQRIREGDSLFLISADSIASVRRKLQNARSKAQLSLTEANTEYRTQSLSAKSAYHDSKAEADTASRSYDTAVAKLWEKINLLTGDIQALQGEILDYSEKLADEDLLEDYDELKQTFEKAQILLNETEKDSVAAYTANYEAYQAAKAAYEEMSDRIQSYQDGIIENGKTIASKQTQISEAEAKVSQQVEEEKQSYDTSVLSGQLADDIYGYTLGYLEESVREAQNELDEAQERLNEFEAFVGEDGTILADGSGLVTAVAYEAGDRLINTGAMLSYAPEDAYCVTIDVSEEDISLISVHDTVEIVFTAYPDETYEGVVTAVGTSSSSGYSSTVNYPVTVQIQGDTTKLYGGMTADITIAADSVSDVLYVPRKALVTQEDGTVCVYKKTGGEKELVPVVTGFTNGTQVEIREGLSEGDTIYVAGTKNTAVNGE